MSEKVCPKCGHKFVGPKPLYVNWKAYKGGINGGESWLRFGVFTTRRPAEQGEEK